MDPADQTTTGGGRGKAVQGNLAPFGPQRICREFREKINNDDDEGAVEFARAQTDEVTILPSPSTRPQLLTSIFPDDESSNSSNRCQRQKEQSDQKSAGGALLRGSEGGQVPAGESSAAGDSQR